MNKIMTQWIKLSEQRPEKNRLVDIFTKISKKRICDCFYDGAYFWKFEDYCKFSIEDNYLSHWMYSPEPPEEE